MNDRTTTVGHLKKRIARFIKLRDWEQFHSPKNISMSVAIEAAELMEIFQWLSADESHTVTLNASKKKAAAAEIADVAMFLIDLCTILDIDLSDAVRRKLITNAKKYPARLVMGKTHKYTYYRKRRGARK